MALKKCKECGAEISKKAEKCPQCGAPQRKRTSLVTWLIAILLGVWLIGYIGNLSENGISNPREPTPTEIALEKVEMDFSWDKAGFDNVMEADFTIKNNSKYQIKDIEIECTHIAKSGTRIDSNSRTIYDVIPANSSKRFEDFNMGFIHSQADASACKIVGLIAQ